MKRSTYLLLVFMACTVFAFAQSTVSVNGIVTDIESGAPVGGHQVFIVSDSSNTPGYISIVFTNDSGEYADSFDVPELSEGMLTVFTYDCNGMAIFHEMLYGPGNYNFTVDFAVCSQVIPVDCFADFWYSLMEDLSVDFQDMSWPEPSSWAWDFGDGTSSEEQNPVHQYSEAGVYPVTLTITVDETGCTSTTIYDVWVDDFNYDCYANFYYYQLGELIVHFQDVSFPEAETWLWEFGDGSTSTEPDPIYTYAAPGFYEVCLTITNEAANCEDTRCMEIFVDTAGYIECYADFLYSQMEDLNVGFQDISWPVPSTWAWDFGDGASSEEQNPVHQYTEAGIYPVTLTITVDETGCTSTTIYDVWVDDYNSSCQALYYWFPESNDSLTLNFFDLSFYQGDVEFYWEFGDGGFSNEQNPVYTFAEEGEYEVCLTISRPDTSCFSTFCEMVYVGDQFPPGCESSFGIVPIQDFSYQFDGYMLNGTIGGEYYWEFGDGNSGFGQSVGHTYDQAGEYVVCLTTISANNPADSCFWISCQMLLVGSGNAPMQASFSMVQDSLNPMMMHFYDNSTGNPEAWLWDFGDGSFSDNQHPVHEFSSTGNFDVCLTIFGQGLTDVYCQQINMTNSTVSISENDSPVEQVFPNPNHGNFFIDISSYVEGPVRVQLFNFVGQIVYSASEMVYQGGKRIELIASDLPPGVYNLLVKSANNQVARKIIIE
ncbi:MAG: PKD domain-containing protein [Bacteroidales bacterium]|nr:PKD domain-containing protein [Bacteroidales bacterium]